MKSHLWVSTIFAVVVTACSPSPQTTEPQPTEPQAPDRFQKLLTEHWEWQLESSPTFATSLGVRDFDDKLSDPSLSAYDDSIKTAQKFLDTLNDIPADSMSAEDQLNAQLLKLDLENQIAASKFGGKYMIMTNRRGPHTQMTGLPNSNLMSPFKKKPASMNQAAFDEFKAQAETQIKNDILPALKKFESFYLNDYAPACRTTVGASFMPGGAEYYAHRVKLFTTTNRTPDEVHNIGLSEVARIRGEMDEVQKQAGFDGTFKEFQNFLRTSPEFYPKTRQERMDAAAIILKKMDGKLPELFTKFPRMPYGLKEIPLDIAEKTTTAYYSRPSGDGSRAGFYFINTTNLDKRPLYEMEALSLHEAVPGHHFQIALAQELPLPNFRKYGGVTAFVEGWGLYSERLGLDVGFYETPYTNFGRLSYEMWRACRLVVDTGMHAKGWSRQEAIDYMAENTGLSLKNITNEVDRYITWPGQALAYKTGELKIRELRARSEETLGEKFDLRLFHDAVLENGAVPLSVLEDKINAWIETQK